MTCYLECSGWGAQVILSLAGDVLQVISNWGKENIYYPKRRILRILRIRPSFNYVAMLVYKGF